jgi:hypothetical protein
MQGKAMPDQNAQAQVYVGVDVCKDWLDVYMHPLSKLLRLRNDRDAPLPNRSWRSKLLVFLDVVAGGASRSRRALLIAVSERFNVEVVEDRRPRD